MSSNLSDRVVLVTGSSSGIGRATAIAFGRERARVASTYHSDQDGAEETVDLVREAGGDAFVRYDMTDPDSIDAAVQTVIDRWGTIDVLVNNAIPSPVGPAPFEDIPLEEWSRIVHGIQDGVFRTIQAALPAMRASDSERIVNVSSQQSKGRQAWQPTPRRRLASTV